MYCIGYRKSWQAIGQVEIMPSLPRRASAFRNLVSTPACRTNLVDCIYQLWYHRLWTNLVVLEYWMLHTNFQGDRPSSSRKKDFLRFLPYMGMAAILVMWPGPFEQTFVPPSHGGLKFGFNRPSSFLGKEVLKCWIWVTLDQGQWMTLAFDIYVGLCTHLVKCIYQFWHHNPLFYLFPYKSIRDQIWPCRKIGQGQPRVIIWKNLVVLEHPMLPTMFQGNRPFDSREED